MRNRIRAAVSVFGAVAVAAPAAHAQGCVLCYTSLAGAGPAAMRAFELAMLTLLIPALLLFAGVFLFIYLRAQSATADNAGTAKAEIRLTARSAGKNRFSPALGATAEGRV